MDYLDFDLHIDAPDDFGYPTHVLQSPDGEADATLQLALDETFLDSLRMLEAIRGVGENIRGPEDVSPVVPDADETALARTVGAVLFDALFAEEIRSRYRSSLATARDQGKRLRVRLRVEAPELALLPWELLFDEEAGDYVNLLRDTPVSRYLEMGRPANSLTIEPPIRLLGMIASPNDLPSLAAEEEKQRMIQAIEHLLDSRAVELTWVDGQSWQALNHALQTEEWHIFHFIGHGDFDPDQGEGRIALVDEESAGAHFLTATQLGRLFSSHPSLRLAVVNACEGARSSMESLYSSTGAVLAHRGVPAVIAMQYTMSDRAAIEFSRAFYDSLARGLAVDESLQEARLAMSMVDAGSAEWATPVLYMRSPDGALFHVDLAKAIFRDAPEAKEPTEPAPPPAEHTPAAGEDRDGLGILLRKVRQYWIEGVFEKSLFQAILLDLDMARMGEAVDSPFGESRWDGFVEHADGARAAMAPQQSLAALFEEEGGSLLVLGDPGSGKTTSLLELARDLLVRAEEEPGRPVPVVFNLSSWVEPYMELDDWLVDELSGRYQIPRKFGRSWLAQSHVLPLLDGLDELTVSRRAACVEAINRFLDEAGLVGAVVCCRLAEYLDLTNRLALNAAVRLLPLADEQVQAYLAQFADRLSGLRAILQRDSALRLEARSPLMLSLMVRAYQDIPAERLMLESAATVAARRQHLMEAYVAHRFRRAGFERTV